VTVISPGPGPQFARWSAHRSTGPHYLYKSFFPVDDVCIITMLVVAFVCNYKQNKRNVK